MSKQNTIFIFCAPMIIGKGGMERTAANVANYFCRKGWKVLLGYMADHETDQPAYEVDSSILKLPWLRCNAQNFTQYRNSILRNRVDCAINFGASWQSMKLAAIFFGTGVPLVVHEGSNPERIITTNWASPRKITREEAIQERNNFLAQASAIRFTLPDYITSLPHELQNKAFAFPNAFHSNAADDIADSKYQSKRIINIGGMKKHKNIEFLLKAYARIADKYPDWRIDIFSGLRHREFVKMINELIKSLKIEGKVLLRGEVENIYEEYEKSSIHVITSLEEGLSSAVAEAMIHGLPSIGVSTCDGVRQLIADGEDGYLVAPGDERGLANCLSKLMSDSKLRSEYGKKAMEKGKMFNPEIVYQKWESVVQSAIEYMNKQRKLAVENNGACDIYDENALKLHYKVFGKAFFELLRHYHEIPDYRLFGAIVSQYKNLRYKRFGKTKAVIFAAGNLYNIGGLQRSYQFLSRHLVGCGYQVTLVAWMFPDSHGAADISYPLPSKVKLLFIERNIDTSGYRKTIEILQSEQADIAIIINSTQDSLMFAAASLSLNIPYIQSLRGSPYYCLRYLWESRYALEATLRSATKCHVLMPSYRDYFDSSINLKTEVISSPIDPATVYSDAKKPNRVGRFVVLYSGRFSFEKRVELLITAFSLVMHEFPDWDLWLYGDGPKIEDLKELAEQLVPDYRIRFGRADNTDDMYKIYPETHLLVLPSEQEGCPMAMREAMAHGVPPIAFKSCSGANEIIINGYNGVLVDSIDDNAKDLAFSMKALMRSAEERARIGASAIKSIESYDPGLINHLWEILIAKAIEFYKESKSLDESSSVSESQAKEFVASLAVQGNFRQVCKFDIIQDIYKKYRVQYLYIYGSRLFDFLYYLEVYPSVKELGVDPLLHYISEGWTKSMNPSPEFDNDLYISRFMNNEKSQCPLFHYYSKGVYEGAWPIPVESDYYVKRPKRKRPYEYSLETDPFFGAKALRSIAR